jgi:hypothetical protein
MYSLGCIHMSGFVQIAIRAYYNVVIYIFEKAWWIPEAEE